MSERGDDPGGDQRQVRQIDGGAAEQQPYRDLCNGL